MRNYLIIGASSGIGKALETNLQEGKDHVIGTYFNNEVNKPNYHYLDVTEEDPDLSFVPEVLDGLVYCPGSINLLPFHRIKAEDFSSDFNLQVVGAIKLIQKLLPNLKRSESASIVLFSTVAVQNGFNFHAQVSSSKGAIEGLCRALSAELAPKIRVNSIAPSLTDTPLSEKLLNTDAKKEANAARHPLKRIGKSEDIANLASFLLSKDSSWMTGQVLKLDGGISTIKG